MSNTLEAAAIAGLVLFGFLTCSVCFSLITRGLLRLEERRTSRRQYPGPNRQQRRAAQRARS